MKKNKRIGEWSILGVFAFHIYMRYENFFFLESSENYKSHLVLRTVYAFWNHSKRHFSHFVLFFFSRLPQFFLFHRFCSFIRYRCSIKVCHIIFCLLSHCVCVFFFSVGVHRFRQNQYFPFGIFHFWYAC